MIAERRLALIAAGQLGFGLTGLAFALRRRHAFSFLGLKGKPEHVARDSVLLGTAFSAPGVMLMAQGAAVGTLLRNPDSVAAAWTLGLLGAGMTIGYTGEELVRTRLSGSGWRSDESPVVACGLLLAVLMARLGLPALRERR